MGKIERIQVPPEDRERLEGLVRDRNTPQKIVWRSQIVLRFRQRLSKSDQSFEGLDRSRCRRPETRQGGPDLGGGRWGQDGASRPEPVKKIILN